MSSNKSVFPLRLESALYEKLRMISGADKRSMNTWVVIAIEKEIARYESININQPLNPDTNQASELIIFCGMVVRVYYDEDGEVLSATNQNNESLYEMLSDYYIEQLNDTFHKYMAGKADEAELDRQLSGLGD